MTLRLPLRLGTRGSPLALAQARMVKAALLAAEPGLDDAAVEIVVVSTQGDRIQDRTLAEIGGKGLFTEEIEAGLLEGTLDIAVHSMKDMPTVLPDGLVDQRRAAARRPARRPDRPRARAASPSCPRVRWSAPPRCAAQAQLRAVRPDLVVVPLRGNVQTRLRKLEAGEVQATFLAMAGLIRLGLEGVVSAALGAGGDAAGGGAGCDRHRVPGRRRGRARAAGPDQPRADPDQHHRRAGLPRRPRRLLPHADRGPGRAERRGRCGCAGWSPAPTAARSTGSRPPAAPRTARPWARGPARDLRARLAPGYFARPGLSAMLVLVTRPREQAAETARLLRAAGPRGAARSAAGDQPPAAADARRRARSQPWRSPAPTRCRRLAQLPADLPVFAVGEATAGHCARRVDEPAGIAGGDGTALAALIAAGGARRRDRPPSLRPRGARGLGG